MVSSTLSPLGLKQSPNRANSNTLKIDLIAKSQAKLRKDKLQQQREQRRKVKAHMNTVNSNPGSLKNLPSHSQRKQNLNQNSEYEQSRSKQSLPKGLFGEQSRKPIGGAAVKLNQKSYDDLDIEVANARDPGSGSKEKQPSSSRSPKQQTAKTSKAHSHVHHQDEF